MQGRLQAEEALKEAATLSEPVACLGCLLHAAPGADCQARSHARCALSAVLQFHMAHETAAA